MYDLRTDRDQLTNMAANAAYGEAKKALSRRLQQYTADTGDPRALGEDAPWDYYPFYGKIMTPGWKVDERPQ